MKPGTLYYLPLSHYCVAAERMLSFKVLPFVKQLVPYHDKQRLIRETGQDYVPCLRWDERVVTWKEIPHVLEEESPTPTLYPGHSEGVADALGEWAHGLVEERAWRVALPAMAETLEDPQERWVFEEMQERARGPVEVVRSRREEFLRDLRGELATLESMLSRGPWVLGAPSRADFAIYGALSPLLRVHEDLPAELVKTRAWVERVAAIPSSEVRAPAA